MAHPVVISQPPGYYIKKRLLQNRPAMTGLGVIIFAAIIAILGYLIMPDASPYANHSIVQLQKKPPGFSVQVLRIKRENYYSQNFLQKWLYGKELNYYEIAVEGIRISNKSIRVSPYVSSYALPEKVLIYLFDKVFD